MGSVNFYILADKGNWFIQLNGKHFGPCPTKDYALNVAISVAKKAAAKGCKAEVLVEGHQRFRTAWSTRQLSASG